MEYCISLFRKRHNCFYNSPFQRGSCMANLFSKHRLIRIIFLIMAFVLIIVATTLYVHKANKM